MKIRRRRAWWQRATAAVVFGSMLSTVAVGGVSAQAALPQRNRPPRPDRGAAASGVHDLPAHVAKGADQPAAPYAPTATRFPAASRTSLTLVGAPAAARFTVRSRAAGTPVWVEPATGYTGPARADVRVLDHAAAQAAGVAGVVFSVAAQGTGSGRTRLGVDYSGFAQAYGGNFGARLRLVQLPSCALTTPAAPACRHSTPLVSSNNASIREVSAEVTMAGSTPMVLAATSDPGQEGSAGGNYAATTLKPSGTWSQGGSDGTFSYNYPISVPPAPSTLVPTVALAYDSGGVDGQTASTQAQSSWIGDGWSMPTAFVEQSFVPCSDSPEGTASPVSTPDECYAGPVLTLSLDGTSTPLVWDATKQVWRVQNDAGQVLTHVVNSDNGTGTYNTDYWTLTTRDGTVRQFGRNHLPGWAAGQPTTNSVDSEPVYSAHAGDPCYKSSGFTASVCTMAYRWNLDYITDAHGNAMSYYYAQDTNFYRQDNSQNTRYVRDSHLDHVDYGFIDGNAYGTAPDRVVFGTSPRCLPAGCSPLSASTKASWPDVPFDLVCAAGTTCESTSPSFFSTVRLTSVSTQQYNGSGYATVDSYTLAQSMPATGDGTSPTLWLDSITRTGSGGSGGPLTLPPVTFGKVQLQNRVDTVTDGLPAFYRYRIASITTESGSVIAPTYTLVSPCTGPVTLKPASNTSSCYPVSWTPPAYTAPVTDWFNKYVLTRVTATDGTGGAPAISTSYVYKGGAAWHFDDNEVVQPKYRTYGQFRGYAMVQTLTGDGANDPQTSTDTTYYRGMGGTLTDSQGGQHADVNQLASMTLESTGYLGNGGPVDHSTVTSYWVSAPTATRDRSGLPALTANQVQPAETYTRQAVTGGATTTWRYTETDTTYDTALGLPLYTYSHTVPANPAYDRCVTNRYAPANTAKNLVGLVGETETDSVACGGFTEGTQPSTPASLNTLTAPVSVNRPAQVVNDTRNFYDDPTFDTTFPQPAPPGVGDTTMVRKAATWTSGSFTYQTTERTAYDGFGRAVAAYDGNGNRTTTTYTMTGAGLTSGVTVANPLSQTTSSTLDPQRGLTLTSTDANGVVTTNRYDALGRITAVWLDSRAATLPANYTYSYQVANTGVTAVTTRKLNDESAYQTSVLLYDALLRERQRQVDTPRSGRMVSDTFYDSRGWVRAKYNGWWDATTTPDTTVVGATGVIPSQDFYTYDGLGRTVVDASADSGVTISTTTTVYNSDRTTVVPPTGGVVQTTVTDPLGRTVELDQYTTQPAVNRPADPFTGVWTVSGGTTTATKYGFDGHGDQATVTDPANNTWTSSFDLLGHVLVKTDPDTGRTSGIYDYNGNLVQSTDARNRTMSTTYDALNRKTSLSAGGVQLATWVYDNANNAVAGMKYPVGHATTTTAYWNGAAYVRQQNGFNVFGESTGESVTIPSTEGALAGTYKFGHSYTTTTGLLLKDSYPAAGGLPAETVNHGYTTAFDVPDTVGGLTGYADGTVYDAFGRVGQATLNAAPNHAFVTDLYDRHTGRETDQIVTREVGTPGDVNHENYRYDPSGNMTRQTSTRLGAAAPAETQCFTYDNLRRLTGAWTATDDCTAVPSAADHRTVGDGLGVASAYWTSWTVDPIGNRTAEVRHSTTGGADATTTYTYGGNGTGQPHTLTATGGADTASYGYDPTGNLTSRNAGAGHQTLTWDDAGRLTTVSGPAGMTGFRYDADGSVLVQADPATLTLYLPGEQIALTTATGATSGTRYYPLPGGVNAVRTGTATAAYLYEITDQHGTPALYLDNTAQQPSWRQSTPYGGPRGATVAAPDNRGFLGKPADTATGLTVVGARQYDPATGHFISRDPVFTATDPQQINGYSYSANNPVTFSDPTGLMHPTDDDGGSSAPVTCEDHCDGSPGDVAARTPGHSDDPDNRPGRPKYANQVYFNAIRFYEAALRSNPTYGLSAAKLAYDAAQRWADEQCKEGVQYACLPLDQQPEGPVAMQMAGPCTHDCDKGWASLVELGLALVGAGMGEAEEPMADDPIPGEHLLKGQEPATAHRLMQESDYTGGQLRAYENPNNPNDHAYDYVDEYGRTYDAIGQEKGFTSRKFDMQKFLQTLDEHVFYKQGLNFTVLDLTGASSRQLDAIFDHIDAYSPAAQRRLKITGS